MSRQRDSQSPRKTARDVKIEAETVVIHGDVAGRNVLKEVLAARPPEAMPEKAVRALVVIASPVRQRPSLTPWSTSWGMGTGGFWPSTTATGGCTR